MHDKNMLIQSLLYETILSNLKYEKRYSFLTVFAHRSKNGQFSLGTTEHLNRLRGLAMLVPDENK